MRILHARLTDVDLVAFIRRINAHTLSGILCGLGSRLNEAHEVIRVERATIAAYPITIRLKFLPVITSLPRIMKRAIRQMHAVLDPATTRHWFWQRIYQIT